MGHELNVGPRPPNKRNAKMVLQPLALISMFAQQEKKLADEVDNAST